MQATVVITTKNRKQEVVTAIASALSQTARPAVLVIDDGSTDGTAELVRSQFPQVQLDVAPRSLGLIVQRNRAAELASGEILFSIDDDAAFSSDRVVEQTLAEFDHPRVGAVAIPFINVNQGAQEFSRAPGETGIIAGCEFIGTAHAVRRDVFRAVGGYRPQLFHQGEERDLAIRLLDAGYIVRLGRSDPIHHFESPRRDTRRMDLYGRRNDVLYAWHNVPWARLPAHLAGTTLLGLRTGVRLGRPLRMLHGLLNGYGAILRELPRRRPVQGGTYRLIRQLKRDPLPLEQIEPMLPALAPLPAA